MRVYLLSYATGEFLTSQTHLVNSGCRYGITDVRSWNRKAVEDTHFYQQHRAILDLPRGGGYWLWKPFIIQQILQEVNEGDILVYSDAGIEIVKELSPLFVLCEKNRGILLFAGHYDDASKPGANQCAKWTKRDCFVYMKCDLPCFHQAQVVDASFIVLSKTEHSQALVLDWLSCCSQRQLLTDQANECGFSDLPSFIEHRHDQSILSLLAAQKQIELFRHPSQYGNHLKDARYREPDEWTRYPYATEGIYSNSPYGTLLDHHRGRPDRHFELRQTIDASPAEVYTAWIEPQQLRTWFSMPGYLMVNARLDLRRHGDYCFEMKKLATGEALYVSGTFQEIDSPRRLIFSWYWHRDWPPQGPNPIETRVEIEFHARLNSTDITLKQKLFPNAQAQNGHEKGWKASLERLEELFLKQSMYK